MEVTTSDKNCTCHLLSSLPETSSLLIVDEDISWRERLGRSMKERQYTVHLAKNREQATKLLDHTIVDYAIVDWRFADGLGLDLLCCLKAKNPRVRVVVLTGHGNIAAAVSAIKLGALDYLTKPVDAVSIDLALKNRDPCSLSLPSDEIMSPDRLKWEHIQRVLVSCNHNISETARRLKMHRRSLQRILHKNAPRF